MGAKIVMIFSLLAFPLFSIVYLFMSTFPTIITKKLSVILINLIIVDFSHIRSSDFEI